MLFIGKFYSAGRDQVGAVSRGIAVYFFVKLLRAGHYFSPEQHFFTVAYCLNQSMRGLANRLGTAGSDAG